jgi:hypothetical protein
MIEALAYEYEMKQEALELLAKEMHEEAKDEPKKIQQRAA